MIDQMMGWSYNSSKQTGQCFSLFPNLPLNSFFHLWVQRSESDIYRRCG